MTALLELRENLKKIYSRNEAFILPVIKFLLGVIVLSIINGKMGYMTKLDNMAIVLIVSLLCSFLPTGFMAFFAMMFAVLHMYALSIETAAVGLVVFLLLYLLFLRFTAKEALVVVLTPVLCMLKLPYVMPVAMGLIGTPASCVSVGCGVVVYYLLQTVITNAPTINSMGAEEATAKLRLLIELGLCLLCKLLRLCLLVELGLCLLCILLRLQGLIAEFIQCLLPVCLLFIHVVIFHDVSFRDVN